jgi:hypothetical protein
MIVLILAVSFSANLKHKQAVANAVSSKVRKNFLPNQKGNRLHADQPGCYAPFQALDAELVEASGRGSKDNQLKPNNMKVLAVTASLITGFQTQCLVTYEAHGCSAFLSELAPRVVAAGVQAELRSKCLVQDPDTDGDGNGDGDGDGNGDSRKKTYGISNILIILSSVLLAFYFKV